MTKKLVVVSSSWCSQCKVLKDLLTRNEVVYHVVDADEDLGMTFCREMNVRSLPTTFIYEDDKIVKVINGVKNLEEYV